LPTQPESAFEEEIRTIYNIWKTELKYNASRFIRMIEKNGGLNTAKALLASKNHPEGLTRLWEEKHLDISMEAIILKETWSPLFSSTELEVASKRLRELGYKKVIN